ncbi:MAG: UDP-3-O-acyl-N-acetylglucosamine deacetylase [Thermodesulfobacteriota bacterium]
MGIRAAFGLYEQTIDREVSVAGVGLHSGRGVNMTIRPADAGAGITFRRLDREGAAVPAALSAVVDAQLATTLAANGVSVATTEHLLGSLAGLGIDNAVIELDEGEVPIMDGSARPFVRLLKKAGVRRQGLRRRFLRITRPLEVRDGDAWIAVSPYEGFKVSYTIDFAHRLINRQEFSLELSPQAFAREISGARTFGFLSEVERLRQLGKGLGGSLANAVVLSPEEVLNVEGLRYADEFVRHKILDLVGDLALLGHCLLGHVQAHKTGHRQHLELLAAIRRQPDAWEIVGPDELPLAMTPPAALAGRSCSAPARL